MQGPIFLALNREATKTAHAWVVLGTYCAVLRLYSEVTCYNFQLAGMSMHEQF